MIGLYFQKSVNSDPEGSPLGKIEFLAEMNLTDQDALTSYFNHWGAVLSRSLSHNSPDLFEIAVTKDQATLYFTPVAGPVSYYYIAYGLSEGDERYGVWFPFGHYTGVISFTIEKLSPNTVYYFKVRGGNGCAPGSWSDWLKAKTTNSSMKNNFYKYH